MSESKVDWTDILGRAVSAIFDSGGMPEDRDSVANCVTHVLVQAFHQYTAGETQLAHELEALRQACFNDEDAVISSVGLAERQGLRNFLTMLKKGKEHAARQKSKELEESAASRLGEGG